MASTERGAAPSVSPLDPARDLPDALTLSRSASWNQNEADWRMMLELGRGWGIRLEGEDGREQLAASTVVIPYAGGFAWVSMVLVRPEFRRRGLASQLLRHALADLRSNGLGAILDATPAGHVVYAEEGFEDTWGFCRYRREANAASGSRGPAPQQAAADGSARAAPARAAGNPMEQGAAFTIRALEDSDWPAILAIDTQAFGGDRTTLLRRLASRLTVAARVAQGADGRIRGFVLGRDGREASQVGPLVADDIAIARALLDDVLGRIDGPLYVDLLERHAGLLPCLAGQGFRLQRPFTRMVHGLSDAPGDPRSMMLVAGPELG